MRDLASTIKIIALTALAIILGLGLGWYAARPKTVPASSFTVTENNFTPADQKNSASQNTPSSQTETETTTPSNLPTPQANTPDPAETDPATSWEAAISDIIADPTNSISAKCDTLFKIFPKLPEAGQIEAAGHIVNLIDDNVYTNLTTLLADAKTSPAVDDIFIGNLMARNNSVKLPVLLQMARNPDHPRATEARDLLERLLEEDHGTDWAAWETKMKTWMKENPD